ncbi:MAG: twin-arginine translocase TatA/TatE family subunit [Bacteroidales bacterium]|nr:twin-arginine translocase TatA/TatE family subunit [Candidatus Cryptobacteroides fimicaballi]
MLSYPLFIGTWELIIIVFVIVLIFGGKKIPELMKGVGKGVKSFKQGLNEIDDQVNQADTASKSDKKTEENRQ